MLYVDDLHFSYPEKPVLKGVTFSVEPGEIIALIGISGSGKTTLFRQIAGLCEPQRGIISIDGMTGPETALLTTYMRQEDLLLPWRTVLGNLMLLTELGKASQSRREMKDEAIHLLRGVGLAGCEDLYPKALSGGMRQRVALARALLQKRPLMLLDEPFASLDVILREQLYTLLREIRDQYNKTIVMVTHDFRDAIALADRILVLAGGKIAATYPVAEPTDKLIHKIRSDLVLEATL